MKKKQKVFRVYMSQEDRGYSLDVYANDKDSARAKALNHIELFEYTDMNIVGINEMCNYCGNVIGFMIRVL